ncbi:3-hydroxyacyl-CoA dehydrogenase [Algimonas ampicilliniresistens]|uniref:3-hydroxyacyl-CoA dehydrogenase n=1 Tax=Algimonas ampicilliniresistens TaxID=1298735 RepID=A0ABQ5V683_9PROT|nr:3-hydroxyacyl-CoA dehydrogenase NAD-binding domain-containing protein [Algimonas ampicilliniresistens]GLQ23056.1 3-hydroxyacyl-CoA dehydrogenase [Algimonas ampicilliniresistens]
MSNYTTFSVEVDADGIAVLKIDVPNQGMNVWDEALMAEFPKFVDSFVSDDAMKGLVIASGRDNGFMAGADLRMLEKQTGELSRETFNDAMILNGALRKLETGGHTDREIQREGKKAKPVAIALEGLALGGGFELALAGHYRVAADSPKVKLGLPEVLVGLLPGGGGTQRVPRLAGLQNAAQLITSGASLNAQKAKAQNLIHEIVEPGTTIDAAKAWVKDNLGGTLQPWDVKGFRVPGGAGAMNPKAVQFFSAANAMALAKSKDNFPAIKAIMSCLYEGTQLPMSKAIQVETKYFLSLFADPVAQNMIRTLFVNKQAAEKGAGRPEGIDRIEIKKVGVLGAGLMGSGIAHVTAKAGMQVISLDRTDEEAQKSVTYTKKILDKRVKRGRMTQEKADAFLARITPTSDYNMLKDVDLIIEAVFERPDVKADVIKKTEAVIRKDVIFASNTSTLPIGGLAENSVRPENFIGLHFFSPVERMPLLEIIPHEGTGDRALAAAFDYNRKIKKTPIVVKDVRGFFTNQVFPPYIAEAISMIMEGTSTALIENSALNMGLPIGPLGVQDETTLKLGYDVIQSTKKELGDAYQSTGTEEFYDLMVNDLGRSGRRFGKGLYNYDESGKRLDLWKGVTDHYPLAAEQPSQAEVQQRLMYAQLIPTARTFSEGVVPDPQSADLGAIFGWGFPPWTGGPMSYIDTIGIDTFVATADMLAQKHGERFKVPTLFRDMAEKGETLYGGAPKAYSKSALERMLEADVVKIANGMGIAASVDDLKADTIAKILGAQSGKKAA